MSVLQRGIRPCTECGRPHDERWPAGERFSTWADPMDGHPYQPDSWESIARRLMAHVQAGAEDPAKPSSRAEASGSQ